MPVFINANQRANQSCDPFPGPDSQCVIGTYVQNAVNVSTPAHVISTKGEFHVLTTLIFRQTVGWAGGYVQGGGHSLMGSKFGMGADQLLFMEVITTTGKFVAASPAQNEDLFWAMSGGVGSPIRVNLKQLKAFPDMPCAGALPSFNAGPTVSLAKWWEAVDFYQEGTPKTTDAGGVSYSFYSERSFQMAPLFLPNSTAAGVKEHIQPLVNKLNSLGIPHNLTIAEFPGFFAAHEGLFPPESFAVGIMQFGGRLLPRSLWESKASLAKLESVVRTMIEDDAVIFDIAVSPTKERGGNPKNPELPARRDAERTFYQTLPWMDRAPLSIAA
ncbi:hypothetical protein BDN71DRAFT_1502514 [Pleurotus eryngii]|uniref:FAD-binding PCMH-type domain-containing protein n=1 Tax=Pleurotus eryngii TaxID=5323 RepID=A0A9P6A976_PLEER|nr:hypothetical protein BDN71DRAFT_1502514 [Pleurotus eryngii]